MRVVAIALLAVIIAAGGYWLSRGDGDQNAGQADAPPPPAQEQSTISSDSAESAPDVAGEIDSAPGSQTQGSEAETAAVETAETETAETEAAETETPGNDASEVETEEGETAEPETSEVSTSAPEQAEPEMTDAESGELGSEDSNGEPDAAQQAPVVLPEGFTAVDYLTDAPKQAFDAAQEVLEDGFDYVAVLRTNRGDITVDLYEDLTPVTVNNFVFLALNHYYDGVPFHRVLENFMAQTGDPTGTGRGGPGYTFDDEIVDSLTFDSSGILAMANAGPGTNGSQFFLTFGPTGWLDGAHTIFGHVLVGDDVLASIAPLDPETPSAVSLYQDTVGSLTEQGITLPGEADETVADAIEALLGTLPVPGQSFNVAGLRAVSGQVGNDPAFGFFTPPDEIYTVVVATKPLP